MAPIGLRKKKIIILSPNAREVITMNGANIISKSMSRILKCLNRYNTDESSMPNPTIIPDNAFVFC
jgi:signal transduction histidine kinase